MKPKVRRVLAAPGIRVLADPSPLIHMNVEVPDPMRLNQMARLVAQEIRRRDPDATLREIRQRQLDARLRAWKEMGT